MKRIICTVAILVAAVIAFPNLSLAETHGVFKVVKGDVKVKSGKTQAITPAKVGQKVLPSDTVITAQDSRAKIEMVDKNVINITPETNVRIDKYEFDPAQKKKNVLLNVLKGKIRSKVNQKYDGEKNRFQVKTPSAVAGVRGTDFLASYDTSTQQTQVVTFEGEVAFGLPAADGGIANPVPVKVGQFTSNTVGAPPAPPAPMPKAAFARMNQETETDDGVDAGPRAPASEGASKQDQDEPEAEKPEASGPTDSATEPEGEHASPDESPTARAPSSADDSGCSMCVSEDSGAPIEPPLPPPPLPGPAMPPMDMVPDCGDFCRDVVESGNTKLLIHIHQGQ